MRVILDRPALVPELIEFLSRASCVAVATRGGTVEVELPYTDDEERARTELQLYVAAWQGLHPEAHASLGGEGVPGPA